MPIFCFFTTKDQWSILKQIETSTIEIIETPSVEKETTTEVETTTEEIPEASIEPKDDVSKKDIIVPEEINIKSNYSTAYNKEAETKDKIFI